MESSTAAIAPATVTIKPIAATYWKRTLVGAGVLGLFLAYQAVRLQDPVYWIGVVVVIALCAAGAALYLARASIVVTPERVGRRGLFGFRWIDRSSLDRLLVVRGYGASSSLAGARTDAFLFDKSGKRVLRLFGSVWAETRIQEFDAALALPTRVRQGPTSVKELRAEEPKALGWSESHPIGSFFVTFAAVLGILIGLLVVGALLSM